jgi:hypothetical protein
MGKMTGLKAVFIILTFPIFGIFWMLYFAYKLIKAVIKL